MPEVSRPADVAKRAADDAADLLGDLAGYSLVEPDLSGRYRLHDLAGLFAVARLSETERDVAARRHAEYHEVVLQAANDLFLQGNDALMAGLALADREWANILAWQAWAAEAMARAENVARLVFDYALSGAHILTVRMHPRVHIARLDAAVAVARDVGDWAGEGMALGNLGNRYADLGDWRRAIGYHEKRLAIAREVEDRAGEGRALGNLGVAYAELGEPGRAVGLFEQALALARALSYHRVEGITCFNLAMAQADLGNLPAAIPILETLDHPHAGRLRGRVTAWRATLGDAGKPDDPSPS